jgi:hypothetical protein
MKNIYPIAITSAFTVLASLSFAQTSNSSAAKPDNQPAPMVLLVPVEIQNKALESGCWAQFYDERNFKGEVLTLVGPAQMDSMDKGTGRQFKRSIDSLVLGPKATLKVFEHQLFRDKSVDFSPNAREPGLINKLGVGGRIQSLQLSCTS